MYFKVRKLLEFTIYTHAVPVPSPSQIYFVSNPEQRILVKKQQLNKMAAADLKMNDLDSVLDLVHQQAGKFFTAM